MANRTRTVCRHQSPFNLSLNSVETCLQRNNSAFTHLCKEFNLKDSILMINKPRLIMAFWTSEVLKDISENEKQCLFYPFIVITILLLFWHMYKCEFFFLVSQVCIECLNLKIFLFSDQKSFSSANFNRNSVHNELYLLLKFWHDVFNKIAR